MSRAGLLAGVLGCGSALLGLAGQAQVADGGGRDAAPPYKSHEALPALGGLPGMSRRSPVVDSAKGQWLDEVTRLKDLRVVTNVQEFGARGDGRTDDTLAIQAAINSLPNGGMVYFPATPTYYIISSTLGITDAKGLSLVGSARSGTVIVWGSQSDGGPPPAGVPMIRIKNGFRVSIKSMAIYGNPTHPPSAIIESQLATDQLDAGIHASSQNFFEDLVLGGDSIGMADKGIVYDKTPFSLDDANDVGNFHRVEIENTVSASVSFEISQTKANTFVDCRFLYSKRGVATSLGAGFQGGSFRWYGGDMGGNTIADFDLGNPNDAVLISGLNSEGSNRLLQTGGPSSAGWPITIEGVRWAANGISKDAAMIVYRMEGPINLFGNIFGDGNPAGRPPPVILLDYVIEGTANLIGNEFLAPNSADANPIVTVGPGPYRIFMQGNTFSDAIGRAKLRPDSSTVIRPGEDAGTARDAAAPGP